MHATPRGAFHVSRRTRDPASPINAPRRPRTLSCTPRAMAHVCMPLRVCSLIKPDNEPAARFNHILKFLNQTAGLSGNATNAQSVLYDNSVYLSEKHHADRNIALAYYMRESGSFGKVGPAVPRRVLHRVVTCLRRGRERILVRCGLWRSPAESRAGCECACAPRVAPHVSPAMVRHVRVARHADQAARAPLRRTPCLQHGATRCNEAKRVVTQHNVL